MDEIKIERRYAISSDKHIELAHFLLRLDFCMYSTYMYKSSLRNVLIKKCAKSMFITAICFFLLWIKLRWPKNKSN